MRCFRMANLGRKGFITWRRNINQCVSKLPEQCWRWPRTDWSFFCPLWPVWSYTDVTWYHSMSWTRKIMVMGQMQYYHFTAGSNRKKHIWAQTAVKNTELKSQGAGFLSLLSSLKYNSPGFRHCVFISGEIKRWDSLVSRLCLCCSTLGITSEDNWTSAAAIFKIFSRSQGHCDKITA